MTKKTANGKRTENKRIGDELIQAFIDDFEAKKELPCVKKANAAFPIVWFGDSEAYFKSERKIVTVGLNPSSREFTWARGERFTLTRENAPKRIDASVLKEQLDGYFERKPYGWFGAFEAALAKFDAGYRAADGKRNRALHVDAFSSLATTPAWSRLKAERRDEFDDLVRPDLFLRLVEELNPDVMVFGEKAWRELKRHFGKEWSGKHPAWMENARWVGKDGNLNECML